MELRHAPFWKATSRMVAFLVLLFIAERPAALVRAEEEKAGASHARFKGVLISPDRVTRSRMWHFEGLGFRTAVLYVSEETPLEKMRAAARDILRTDLNLGYWIEIGRNPKLAEAHPEWMASIQTHSEWRRHFPDFPEPKENQVVKNYPWVPVLYRETFDVHLQRVAKLLQEVPPAHSIFLNDLQGAPSACGCGNSFCRWTPDYGPLTTATRLSDGAAAEFLKAVRKLSPRSKVIPVWTTECAEHDAPKGAACDGVACFKGACWREYAKQLMPVSEVCDQIGVLLPFQDFGPELSKTGANGNWQRYALQSFSEIVPNRGGKRIAAHRLISVVQGWGVTQEEQDKQIRLTEEMGTGILVALTAIEQGWEPRLFDLPKKVE